MTTFIRYLPALACVGAMVLCMRGIRGPRPDTPPDARGAAIADLRREVEELRSRIGDDVSATSDEP
jgi:hypothetical protein